MSASSSETRQSSGPAVRWSLHSRMPASGNRYRMNTMAVCAHGIVGQGAALGKALPVDVGSVF